MKIVLLVLLILLVFPISTILAEEITPLPIDHPEALDCFDSGLDEEMLMLCRDILGQCDFPQSNQRMQELCDAYNNSFVLKKAIENNDVKECENIESLPHKEYCYYEIAVRSGSGDARNCDMITDDGMRKRCVEDIPITLITLSEADIPSKYKPQHEPEDYELFEETKLIHERTVHEYGSSTSDAYQLSSLNPEECEKIRNARSVAGNDIYAGCIQKIAVITGDYTLCNHIDYAFSSKADCAKYYAQKKDDLRACFLIDRSEEASHDHHMGFTRCLFAVISGDPTEEGCELLTRTVDGRQDYADRCYKRLGK